MEKKETTVLDRVYRGYSLLNRACCAVGVAAVFVMMFIIVIDVFCRNFMPFALQGVYEIVQWFLLPVSCITFFGYAYACGIMPRVTMVVDKFRPQVRRVVSCGVLTLNTAMFLLMTCAGVVYAGKQMGKGGVVWVGKSQIPVWPLYWLLTLAFAMVVMECIFALVKNLRTPGRDGVTYEDD